MLVGRCLNALPATQASRSKSNPQRCCALTNTPGHQQTQVAQAAARTSASSQVYDVDIVAPGSGRISELFQLLEGPHPDISVQAALNEKLKRCTGWRELSILLDTHRDILDFVNISTAWTRLATLYGHSDDPALPRQALPAPPVQESAFRQFLSQLILTTQHHLRLFGLQALANVIWALSNADWQLQQHEPAVGELVDEWCTLVSDRLSELRAPDISNISTAIGRLDNRWRPKFVVDFYSSVLQRDNLLTQIDVTTLNNLLFGLSRARRRGLIHFGPATWKSLGHCIRHLLERTLATTPNDSAAAATAARLTPWRAGQLLYNCHELSLRIGESSYGLLMPLVAQLYEQNPNPMDRWSFSFLTNFVCAHRRVKPQHRPDLTPLYRYLERRLGEASTSQLAMLSHVLCELRCPPRAVLWAHVFSRYLPLEQQEGDQGDAQEVLLRSAGAEWHGVVRLGGEQAGKVGGLLQEGGQGVGQLGQGRRVSGQQQQQRRQQQQELGQQQDQTQAHHQPWRYQEQQQHQQRHIGGQQSPHQAFQQQQHHHARPHRQPTPTAPLPMSPHCVRILPHHSQVLRAHAQTPPLQRQPSHSESQDTASSLGFRPESPHAVPQHQLSDPHHTSSSRQPRTLYPPDTGYRSGQEPAQAAQPQPPQQTQVPQLQPRPPQYADGTSATNSIPSPPPQPPVSAAPDYQRQQHQEQEGQHEPSPQGAAALRPAGSGTRPPTRIPDVVQQQPLTQPQPNHPHYDPKPSVSLQPIPCSRPLGHPARPMDDDLLQPRTLHYVCWQAAKTGIRPPRVFLLSYIECVPSWLAHDATDREVAQAVATLQLMRWVPPAVLRESLCGALYRRAPHSVLPLRRMLYWVQRQR